MSIVSALYSAVCCQILIHYWLSAAAYLCVKLKWKIVGHFSLCAVWMVTLVDWIKWHLIRFTLGVSLQIDNQWFFKWLLLFFHWYWHIDYIHQMIVITQKRVEPSALLYWMIFAVVSVLFNWAFIIVAFRLKEIYVIESILLFSPLNNWRLLIQSKNRCQEIGIKHPYTWLWLTNAPKIDYVS